MHTEHRGRWGHLRRSCFAHIHGKPSFFPVVCDGTKEAAAHWQVMSRRFPKYQNTHVVPYFMSLLVANVIQGLGTALDARWLVTDEIEAGGYCSTQGALKNAGNVAMAVWYVRQ